ncbi:MAG: pyridoxamine 5'-phosphate oxidase family protein [Candidatus Limnocylindrales bacterium]
MSTWAEIEEAEPELAGAVRARFEEHGFGLLATLRRDGAPRISGVVPLFALGELWLPMLPGSRKALDLLADPRFALHCATIEKDLAAGDAKLSGRATPVDDEATVDNFCAAFAEVTDDPPPDGPFPLFRAEVLDMSIVRSDGDRLDIRWWREGEGVGHAEAR